MLIRENEFIILIIIILFIIHINKDEYHFSHNWFKPKFNLTANFDWYEITCNLHV